eukprot:scaffold97546_cov19-Tisochrysis_lutea.AAC.5
MASKGLMTCESYDCDMTCRHLVRPPLACSGNSSKKYPIKDMVDGTAAPKPPSPARQVLQSNAEVKVEMKKGKGFSDTGITTEQQAKAAVDQFMINMVG